jgi:hypothetical protein
MYHVTVTETWSFPDDWIESDDVQGEIEAIISDCQSNSYDIDWEHVKDK